MNEEMSQENETRSGMNEVKSNTNFFGLWFRRFATRKVIKYVGVREFDYEPQVNAQNQLWEIFINKEVRSAIIRRDGEDLVTIYGSKVSHKKLENIALSAVRHMIIDNIHCQAKKHRRRAEKAADKAKAIAAGEES